LQVVGIPYEMVVNICQDGKWKWLVIKGRFMQKITINKYDTADTILEKVN